MRQPLPELRLRPGARAEIREARPRYEHEAQGLGRAFLAEVDAALTFARRHPAMYRPVAADGAVRRVLLNRLPYALVYEPFPDLPPAGEMVVLACFHVRGDPQDWAEGR